MSSVRSPVIKPAHKLVGVTLLVLSTAAGAQSDAVCLKALEAGTTKYDSNSNLAKVSHLYHTFCRTKIERFDQVKQRSDDAGIPLPKGLRLEYKGRSLKTETREYFEAYCSDLENFSSLDESNRTVIVSANDEVGSYLDKCKTQPGFVTWVEYTPDPRRFTVHFEYNPIPLVRSMPRLVFSKRDADRSIQLRPAGAFEDNSCSNEPEPGEELTPMFKRSISCSVRKDWAGSSVTVSAELITGSWWNRDVVPAMLHIDVPPLAPPEPDKPLPALVLIQHENFNPMLNAPPPQQSAPLGKWVNIDLGQFPSAPSGWRSWNTPSFTLRIHDPAGVLSGENITGRMQMFTWRDIDAWKTDYRDSSGPMQYILVERELTAANSATFVSMSNGAYNDKPDKRTGRSAGTVQLDASKAQSIGMQAQFTEGCLSEVMTTSPGGGPISLTIGRLVPKCILRMRICAADNHPKRNFSNSCQATLVDGFTKTAEILGRIPK